MDKECSMCGKIFDGGPRTAFCVPCSRKNGRMNTKCRRASSPSCLNCGENDAKMEYFLIPPIFRDNKKRPARWCPLCKECIDYWLEEGTHRHVDPGFNMPAASSLDRPLMWEERESIKARQIGTLDSSTGLLTWDWRRHG